MNPPNDENAQLARWLDEWQIDAGVDASPGFEQRLHARIATEESRRHGVRAWWEAMVSGLAPRQATWAGALTALVVSLGFLMFYHAQHAPAPVSSGQEQAAVDPMVRDLQALNDNRDQLDSLEVLNGGSAPQSENEN